MKLSRRDALAALAATGTAVGGAVVLTSDDESNDRPLDADSRETMIAAAHTLYPTPVENVASFVETFLNGRVHDHPDHAAGIATATNYLDDYARAWHDEDFADLHRLTRSDALHAMNADTADPDPSGNDVERVRYYVVNDLLYALYASPTGGKLVGIENPIGHPGGTGSYQQPP
ncbi:gluconate 2-dehydrogenase subunit 3 family protein [Salarchaeum sp. III]|uniref:gluconate 2-dehydrogenase subunit 3 family protein n=1 Tax=Salarchaeum sp. III TaxID=3107927 RepID=UPI002ED9BBD8